MSNSTVLEQIAQAEPSEAGVLFREEIRFRVRSALFSIIEEEVESLCGPKYNPTSGGDFSRGGSTPSSVYVEGKKESIKRPRVREFFEGGSREITLKTIAAAKDPEQWEAIVMQATLCGVSCRDHQKLRAEELNGKSASSISRIWSRKAEALIAELNERDLSDHPILVLMLDGVFLNDDLCAIAALGIDTKGEKHILGFAIGGSENDEVSKDLVKNLKRRGLTLGAERLLCVLDGSKALRNGVLSVYPTAEIQRCLVHKERNIRGYLSRKHHGKLAGFFKSLRQAQGEESAGEIVDDLEAFLASKNKEALNSLHEARGELLTVFRLNVPSTLNRTLLSTNNIENAFRNLRRHLGRVNRWRGETDMARRWVASGLMLAEKTFNRIPHYGDLADLKLALDTKTEVAQ